MQRWLDEREQVPDSTVDYKLSPRLCHEVDQQRGSLEEYRELQRWLLLKLFRDHAAWERGSDMRSLREELAKEKSEREKERLHLSTKLEECQGHEIRSPPGLAPLETLKEDVEDVIGGSV